MADIPYPVRINRYLFLTGRCSRREADRLIERGAVFVNGAPAQLGQQIHETDTVTLSAEAAGRAYRYVLYHKPRGIVSHNPQRNERSVEDVSGLGGGVFPVGRLDKASRGLMLLSDDGRIVNALLNPAFAHEREYHVRVDKYIKERDLKRLASGVAIEGYRTKPACVRRIGERSFSLTLTEGKKHQIRRMCAALGYQVQDLKRVRIMHLALGKLRENESRPLTARERDTLLDALHIPHPDTRTQS